MDTSRFLVEIETEITRLQHIADALRGLSSKRGASRGKRKGMSAAARKKISLAQKARWATQKATPKRMMSASGRRAISLAQKARWAKTRRESKAA